MVVQRATILEVLFQTVDFTVLQHLHKFTTNAFSNKHKGRRTYQCCRLQLHAFSNEEWQFLFKNLIHSLHTIWKMYYFVVWWKEVIVCRWNSRTWSNFQRYLCMEKDSRTCLKRLWIDFRFISNDENVVKSDNTHFLQDFLLSKLKFVLP